MSDEMNGLNPSSWSCIDTNEHRQNIQHLDAQFERFVWMLKRREVTKSIDVVTRTVELLNDYISHCTSFTVAQVIALFREIGRIFTEARPVELLVGNVVRRVLNIIKHAAKIFNKQDDFSRSLYNHGSEDNAALGVQLADIREDVQSETSALMEDVQCMDSAVYDCALSHIYSNEVILTYGYSRTVFNFLRKAHRKDRAFGVLVAECAPSLSGQRMAAALAQAGVPVTLIADAAVLAVMPSVSKVVLGAHAVLANGGLVAHTGASNLCLCAKRASVPVMALAGLHKLTPLYAFDQDTFNEHECPAQLLRFDEALEGRVDVVNPCFDYVPPELLALIVTDLGAYAPAYIHKQLSELYAPEFFTL